MCSLTARARLHLPSRRNIPVSRSLSSKQRDWEVLLGYPSQMRHWLPPRISASSLGSFTELLRGASKGGSIPMSDVLIAAHSLAARVDDLIHPAVHPSHRWCHWWAHTHGGHSPHPRTWIPGAQTRSWWLIHITTARSGIRSFILNSVERWVCTGSKSPWSESSLQTFRWSSSEWRKKKKRVEGQEVTFAAAYVFRNPRE